HDKGVCIAVVGIGKFDDASVFVGDGVFARLAVFNFGNGGCVVGAARIDPGRIVAAGNGNRQGGGIETAIAVADLVGNRGGGAFAIGQVVEVAAGCEGVAAVRMNDEGAAAFAVVGVHARNGRAGRHPGTFGIGNFGDHQGVAIGVIVAPRASTGFAAQYVAGNNGVLFRGGGVVVSRGGRVVDAPVERQRCAGTVRVGGGNDHVVNTVAVRAALTGRAIKRTADDAGDGIQHQAGGQARGGKGQRIAIGVGK